MVDLGLLGEVDLLQGHARHQQAGVLGDGVADGLGHEGHSARGARVGLNDVQLLALDSVLDVHEADHLELLGDLGRPVAHLGQHLLRDGLRGDDAGAVAAVHARFLDVLHDAADDDVAVLVGQAVHVHLHGALEVLVHQHRLARVHLHRGLNVLLELLVAVHDAHGAAAEHKAGAHHAGVSQLGGLCQRLLLAGGSAAGGLVNVELGQHLDPLLAVLRRVDGLGLGAPDLDNAIAAGGRDGVGGDVLVQGSRQLERRLATKLHNDAIRALHLHHVEHVLQGQRLEVQAARGVVVGGDRLGVAVHHDGLVAGVAQAERRVAAAVVKLNALPNAVGAAAQDEHLLRVGGRRLAVAVIGGVHVGGLCGELGGAGVDAFVARNHAGRLADGADIHGVGTNVARNLAVTVALLLELLPVHLGQLLQLHGLEPHVGLVQVRELGAEPGVNLGEVVDLLLGQAVLKCLLHEEHALGVGVAHVVQQLGPLQGLVVGRQRPPVEAGLQAAERLLEGLLEGAAHGHRLTHTPHHGGQDVVGAGELLEGEAGDLGHDVVNGGLEGRGGLPGDIVGDHVQGVAAGQLGGDLCNGEASGLGGERGGAAHAGVHLNDDHLAVLRVDGVLHVRAAALNAHLADDVDGVVTQALVLAVGQGLRGGDGDGVASVHAHGIQVLDGAHDDNVVALVTHDLQLILFPAEQGLLHQDLVGHGGVQATGHNCLELLHVVGNAAAGAAQGEGGANDDGKLVDSESNLKGLLHGVGGAGLRLVNADLVHGVFKERAVLREVNALQLGAKQLHAVLGQDARLLQALGRVEAGLSAHGGQDGVGPLLGDDGLQQLGDHRADIGAVRGGGVGHDGGGVGVYEDDLVPVLPQSLTRLGSRVVELAGLANHDGAGANNHDSLDVGPIGDARGQIPGRERLVAVLDGRGGAGDHDSRLTARAAPSGRGASARPRNPHGGTGESGAAGGAGSSRSRGGRGGGRGRNGGGHLGAERQEGRETLSASQWQFTGLGGSSAVDGPLVPG
mmetsp:Transcript_894/g.2080  ORF Transcript_894/g.2080 Transcript_894/m.2080 type:complete len:1014 (-) Transcript_894:28-3069(-)